MALYLVQHGKNLSKDIDPDQSLSEEGESEVRRIAETAKSYGVMIGAIRHSGKKRARQTAEIFSEYLNVKDVEAAEGLKALDDVTEKAEEINAGQNVMLVGHLPFMERMAAYLTTGSTEYTIFKFQNGGIVCLEQQPEQAFWVIKWAFMPTIE